MIFTMNFNDREKRSPSHYNSRVGNRSPSVNLHYEERTIHQLLLATTKPTRQSYWQR